ERAAAPSVPAGLGQRRPEHLTQAQAAALAEVERALDTGGFQPFLLQGVTGSGKTEVYLRAAEHALARGGGALVLVPEIALTPQLVGRFRSRFGAAVAVLHSGLKDAERLLHWQALRPGSGRRAGRGLRPGARPRAPGGRRGARPLVQARREAAIPGPGPGGGAGQAARGHRGPRVGHTVAGDGGERPPGPVPTPPASRAGRRPS